MEMLRILTERELTAEHGWCVCVQQPTRCCIKLKYIQCQYQ